MRVAAVVLAVLISSGLAPAGVSPAERAAGWRMLFDGESWDGWRSYKKDSPPAKGWVIEDGALRVVAGGGGGDIVTDEEFGDFELSLEFRVSRHANSGIIYRVDESRAYPWMTGPEYQVLDDARPEAANALHSAGAVYDIYSPAADKPVKESGVWNRARIRVSNGLVQHFLNGAMVAEYVWDSEEWLAGIAGSKFRDMEGFGRQARGHIALQDHGDDVWFRDIRVRDLDKAMPGQVTLFNGENIEGWDTYLDGPGEASATWTVRDGVLVCSGSPNGYIETAEQYRDFVLMFSWRFTPEAPGNSGVLLRTVGQDRCWPDCVEAQLMSGKAGDFWNMTGGSIEMARPNGRNGKKSHPAERPVGSWNDYEIVCEGDRITLLVNGQNVNEAGGCPERAGTIGFQSEGAEIHFKSIRLAPIEEPGHRD